MRHISQRQLVFRFLLEALAGACFFLLAASSSTCFIFAAASSEALSTVPFCFFSSFFLVWVLLLLTATLGEVSLFFVTAAATSFLAFFALPFLPLVVVADREEGTAADAEVCCWRMSCHWRAFASDSCFFFLLLSLDTLPFVAAASSTFLLLSSSSDCLDKDTAPLPLLVVSSDFLPTMAA